MSQLVVWIADRRVGALIHKPNGNLQFRYDPSYDGPPISQSLALQAVVFNWIVGNCDAHVRHHHERRHRRTSAVPAVVDVEPERARIRRRRPSGP